MISSKSLFVLFALTGASLYSLAAGATEQVRAPGSKLTLSVEGYGNSLDEADQQAISNCRNQAATDGATFLGSTRTSYSYCGGGTCVRSTEHLPAGVHINLTGYDVEHSCLLQLPNQHDMSAALDARIQKIQDCRKAVDLAYRQVVDARNAFHTACRDRGLNLDLWTSCGANNWTDRETSDIDSSYRSDVRLLNIALTYPSQEITCNTTAYDNALTAYQNSTPDSRMVVYSDRTLATMKALEDKKPEDSISALPSDWINRSSQ